MNICKECEFDCCNDCKHNCTLQPNNTCESRIEGNIGIAGRGMSKEFREQLVIAMINNR